MALDIVKFIKGILVKNDTDTSKQLKIEVSSSATTATTTTLQSAQTSNVTVTLPNATDTLVGRATTDTLTNKTLTAPVINSPTGLVKADVGLSNVDNTSDATKNSATATLTNKTIDGGSNTITNVIATNVSGTVAIANGGTGQSTQQTALDALAGAVTSAQYLRGNGTHVTMSAIQASDVPTLNQNTTGTAANVTGTVAVANGGTGQTSTSAAFDALAPTVGKGDIIVRNSTTNTSVSVGSDGQVLVADASQSTGVKWAAIQAGAKNYISNNNFETNSTAGWNTFTTTMTGVVPTGAISNGAASITIFQPTTTNPLAGTYSLQVQGSPTFPAGQGFYTQFTPDREDRAKVLQISFNYEFVSATGSSNFSGTSANTFHVYIYDITNSVWIQPAGVYGMVQNSGAGKLSATFQTNSTATTYNLVVLCANTASGTTTMNFDDFSVGPQIVTQGTAVAATISGSSSAVTSGNPVIYPTIVTDTHGGYNASTGRYTVPVSGHYEVNFYANGAASINYALYKNAVSQQLIVSTPANGVGVGSALIFASAGDILDVRPGGSTTPVGNISFSNISSATPSSDTDTRVVAARAFISSASVSVGATALIPFNTVSFDTHGTFNTSTSAYKVPVSGLYEVVVDTETTTTANNLILVNGSIFQRIGPNSVFGTGQALLNLVAGDLITVFSNNAGSVTYVGTNQSTSFSVKRLSGPATIAATESVNARYYQNSPQTLTNAVTVNLNFDTADFDTHNAVTTGSSWKYTAPVSGKYRFSYQAVTGNNTWSTSQTFVTYFRKNGTTLPGANSTVNSAHAAGTYRISNSESQVFILNAGEYVDVQVVQNGITSALYNASISVERVGN